jgi:hypothetical protein
MQPVKYWEIIADNLKKAGWSLDYVSVVDGERRTIWIADAHCGDGKRFVPDERRNLNELAFENDRREWDKRNLLPFSFIRAALIGKR